MKLTIPNRDIDSPDTMREVSPAELDLTSEQPAAGGQPERPSSDFTVAISLAAAVAAVAAKDNQGSQERRAALAMAKAGYQAVADQIQRDTGYSVGGEKPWVFKPKAKNAYNLWKRVVPMFVQQPETLNWGATELAKRLNESGAGTPVTRDMIYDGLNALARKELARMLIALGVMIKLKAPVTIRSVQRQLAERREMALNPKAEEFTATVSIWGDTACVNGRPYKIQVGATGQRRVKIRGVRWLPLDTLKEFCAP